MSIKECYDYFKNYKYKQESDKDRRFWSYRFKEYNNDIDAYITRLLFELTCSRKSELYGFPIITTNSVTYNALIAEALYFIANTPVEEHNRLCQLLVNRHEKNIIYERDNPPPVYKKLKSGNSRKAPKEQKDKTVKKALKVKQDSLNKLKMNLLSFKFTSKDV